MTIHIFCWIWPNCALNILLLRVSISSKECTGVWCDQHYSHSIMDTSWTHWRQEHLWNILHCHNHKWVCLKSCVEFSIIIKYTLRFTIMIECTLHTALSPKVQDQVVTGLRTTQIVLTRLIPFLNYTFFVTAENNVFHNDTNVNGRTSNTTANTLEGGIMQTYSIHI